MFGNLFGLLVLVALVVLFGWLAKRAWSAKRWFVKFPGVILAGLLALLVLAVVFAAGKGVAIIYFPGSEPVTNLKVEGTPEQIARGKYIAYIGCAGCHGDKGEFPLTGGLDIAGDVPMPIGSMLSANLTPGGVLKERTDGELFRVLRHGIAKDGTLSVMMSIMPYRELSDEDTKALIAFLRSQGPVETKFKSGDDLNLLAAFLFGAGMFPAPEPIKRNAVTAPTKGINPEYGKYVATFGECRGCHGPNMTGSPPNPAQPDGVPNPRPLVGTWTREQFIQTMRTGIKPTGQKFPAGMPWVNASRMSDEDLSALYEYLKAKP